MPLTPLLDITGHSGEDVINKTTLILIILLFMTACHRRVIVNPPPFVQPIKSANALDAENVSQGIKSYHLTYGSIMDPYFMEALDSSSAVLKYDRVGDSAIWTGHYLAAEAFRYKVTQSSDSITQVWSALRSIRSLIDITGTHYLARFKYPTNSPYDAAFRSANNKRNFYNTILSGVPTTWIAGTSRDQYSGVFFGWGVAYQLADDPSVKQFIKEDVTRVLDNLLSHAWTAVEPNRHLSATFIGRPEQQLNFLQIGRLVNSDRFRTQYEDFRRDFGSVLDVAIRVETQDTHDSYFKFNLDTINFFNLITLEESTSSYRSSYLHAYHILRRATENHGNAFFNMVDRAINGPHQTRDAQTVNYLGLVLQRPRFDVPVDVSARYPACGDNKACQPIPVQDRPTTDFLWQRSPFQLKGGGDNRALSNGIDYILPYWMARYYNVLSQ